MTRAWWTGRSGLIIPFVLAAFCTYLLVGVLTMEVPEGTATPGPKFFPTIVLIAGYVVAGLLVVKYVREPEVAEPPRYSEYEDVSDQARAEAEAAALVPHRTFSDWESVLWAAGGLLAFALLLIPAGWIVAGALLFWCVARAMGSRRPLFDVAVAATMSSLVYLAFGVLLGLNLPSGILGGL